MKKMSVLFICFALALAISSPIAVAQPDPAVQLKAMKKLEFLIGNWEGGGWSTLGPGNRSEFVGKEKVEWVLDGMVVRVEGTHWATDEATGKKRLIHHAFGVLSYDSMASEYRFQAYLATGMAGNYKAEVEDGVLIWGFDVPQGTVRYTVRLNENGEWYEVGHFNPKGTDMWHQTMEMTLQKEK